MQYANIGTNEIRTTLPNVLVLNGQTITGADISHWAALGWREVVQVAEPTAGYRVTEWTAQEIDGRTCRLLVAAEVNIAEEAAAAAAAARAAQTAWLKEQIGATNELLPFVMKAMVAELRQEIIDVHAGGTARTQNQLIQAIAATAESLIDARP